MIRAKLTTFDTTMIVVSLVIGIGIFRTPAIVASSARTPFLFFLAWGLAGVISLFGALTFAEIGSRFPEPGAYYKVVAANYSSLVAFMLNWTNAILVNGAGGAAVALIGAEYLTPILLPAHLQTRTAVQLTAAALVAVLLAINYLGIKTGAWAQNVLSLLKVLLIGTIAVAAFASRGAGATMGGAAPAAAAALPLEKSWFVGLAAAFVSVFYTYGGYQCSINFGADVKDARRNLPRGILFGSAIILLCYLGINAAYWKVLGIPGIAAAKLVAAETARVTLGNVAHVLVSMTIFLSAMGFVNVTLMQIPRAYYAMAQDRTLPSPFKKINPGTQTAEFGLLFLGGLMLLSILVLGTFESIVNYVMFLDSANIALVASTIFALRKKAKRSGEAYTGYKIPFYPVLPIVLMAVLFGVAINVLLTQTKDALSGAACFALGLPVFFLMRFLNRAKAPDEESAPAR